LGVPERSTSPPPDRRVPHPPTAASAAGGWGSPDLRRVYSVGSVWELAGGVGERAARPEWLFVTEIFLSGGGGLRSSAADLPSSACSELGGAAGHENNPWPVSAGRRFWAVKTLKMTTWWFAAEPMFLGVTSPEAVSEDFPVATGMLSSIQGVWTSIGGGASSSRSGCRRCWSSEGLLCIFFCFLGFSVRSNFL
jgi:hypothetical protein